MPISAARAHSALRAALLASLSARSSAAAASTPHAASRDASVARSAIGSALAEFAQRKPGGKNLPAPRLQAPTRPARRAGSAAERARPPERDAHRVAGPRHVAPHVAALGGIDVERRIAPALRGEDRPEQERAPGEAHAPRLGERADPERRRIGIGARELVPELRARHRASRTAAPVLHGAAARRKRRGANMKKPPRPMDGAARSADAVVASARRLSSWARRRGAAGVISPAGFFILALMCFLVLGLLHRVLRRRHRVRGGGRGGGGRGGRGRVGLGEGGERRECDRGGDPERGECLQHCTVSMRVVRLLVWRGDGMRPPR